MQKISSFVIRVGSVLSEESVSGVLRVRKTSTRRLNPRRMLCAKSFERTLAVVANSAAFDARKVSGHEKFLALHQFIAESNQHIAVVFDNRRRSCALFQIAGAVARGIMSEDELNSFSEETQERVRALVAIGG